MVRRRRFVFRLLPVLLAALLLWGSCARETAYRTVGPGLEPLRADFNEAAGFVRVVMLVAPT